MKMLFIRICAAIVASATLGIAYSGCVTAGDTSGSSLTSRVDKSETDNSPLMPWETSNDYAPRIIGGRATKIKEFPFLASLAIRGNHTCCGNIITVSWILTAAHCLHNGFDKDKKIIFHYVEDFSVVAGTTLLTTLESSDCVKNQVRRRVKRFLLPPGYDEASVLSRDVALVALSSPLTFDEKIEPAPLPKGPLDPRRDFPTGRRCYVAGWGMTKAPEEAKNKTRAVVDVSTGVCVLEKQQVFLLLVLHKVTLPLLSHEMCIKRYGFLQHFINESTHICTLSREGKDTCDGDSGAPIVCDGIMVAISSWGQGCAEKSSPSIYTRIDPYLKWLDRVTDYRRINEASRPPSIIAPGQLAVALAVSAMHGASRGQLLQSVLTL